MSPDDDDDEDGYEYRNARVIDNRRSRGRGRGRGRGRERDFRRRRPYPPPRPRPVPPVYSQPTPRHSQKREDEDHIAIRKSALLELIPSVGKVWASFLGIPDSPQATGDDVTDRNNASDHREALARHTQNQTRILALTDLAAKAVKVFNRVRSIIDAAIQDTQVPGPRPADCAVQALRFLPMAGLVGTDSNAPVSQGPV